MPATLDLQIAAEQSGLPTLAEFQRWANTALVDTPSAELTIRVVEADESQQLNHDYRGKNKPTNVLSFPFESDVALTPPLLGDLIICASVVASEALAQHKSLEAHWAHMVVHGILHLLGYDHVEPAGAACMEHLEITLLNQLGYPDPYGDMPSHE